MARKKIDSPETHTMSEWAEIYEEKTGFSINMNSLRKRREMAGVGRVVPPRTYLLTIDEFRTVLATPLPQCTRVIDSHQF